MRLLAAAARHQLRRVQSSCIHYSHPSHPPSNTTLRHCPVRSLTTPSNPHRPSIGRIHPIPASSRHSTNDPAAAIPDLFDIPHSDKPPRTRFQRALLVLRRSGRVVFAVCVVVVGVASLATIGYDLLLNPAQSAHSHSFHFIQHHPTAVGLLGGGRLIDVSDPMRGQYCNDTVRQVGDEQWAQCVYRVRGDAPHAREGEVTAVMKRGKRGGWLVVYVTMDAWTAYGRRKHVVVCDYRNQVQHEQQHRAVSV